MRNQWLKSLVPAVALCALPVLPAVSQAGVAIGVSITVAPPALPVYVQPPLPGPGYIWVPGYWAWGKDGYYWVPGTWVLPPQAGLLWTPGYWGWVDGAYLWHAGYWGSHVGFYGGINYGCGYTGVGFQGGYWRGGAFFYNRAVMNVGSVHVTRVYNRTVINNVTVNRVSFNGGSGGIHARPTAHELAYDHERHFQPTSLQRTHEHAAFSDRNLRASVNHGAPPVAATARPAMFSGRGVVSARGSGPHGGPAPTAHNAGPAAHGPEAHGGPGARGPAFAGAHGPAGSAGHATPSMRNDRPAPNMNAAGHNTPERMIRGNSAQARPAPSVSSAHPAPRPAPNTSGAGRPAPNMNGGGRPAPNMNGGGHPAPGPGSQPRPAPNMAPHVNRGASPAGHGGGRPAMNNAPRPAPNGGGGRAEGGHPQQQGHRSERQR